MKYTCQINQSITLTILCEIPGKWKDLNYLIQKKDKILNYHYYSQSFKWLPRTRYTDRPTCKIRWEEVTLRKKRRCTLCSGNICELQDNNRKLGLRKAVICSWLDSLIYNDLWIISRVKYILHNNNYRNGLISDFSSRIRPPCVFKKLSWHRPFDRQSLFKTEQSIMVLIFDTNL